MRWGASQWLWALGLVPVIAALLYYGITQRRKATEAFALAPLWSRLAPELDWSRWVWRAAVWLSAFTFVVLALARPQWGKTEETVPMVGLDLMVALDVSNSMLVEDVVPNRLQKAKHFLRSMLDHLEGDRVGVVAFAGSSYLASPLTTDLDYVREILQITTPKSVLNQGSDLGIGLETAVAALQRAAESSGKGPGDAPATAPGDSGGAAPERVVLLVSDGEDLEGQAAKAAEAAKAAGVKVFVVGVGTSEGGPIPVRDESGQLHGYKRNNRGQSVVSAFQSKDLESVAQGGGGRFWTLSQYENELQDFLFELGRLQRTKQADRKIVLYRERFQWPLGLAFLLLVVEMAIPLRRQRKSDAGKFVPSLAIFAVVFLLSGEAYADSPVAPPLSNPSVPSDLISGPKKPPVNTVPTARAPLRTYLGNRDALKSLAEGKASEARRALGRAQATDPDRPELFYNQGVLDLQEEKWSSAAENFGRAADLAKQKGQSALAGTARLNEGLAQEGAHDAAGALRSYIDGIQEARKAGDVELESDLRKKIEIFDQQEQKKNQEKQDKEKQDKQDQGDKPEGDPKDEPGDKKDQSGKPENEKGESENKEPGKTPEKSKDQGEPGKRPRDQFKSQRMNPEDAERVMSELSNREKELKGKLQRQKGQSRPSERDW